MVPEMLFGLFILFVSVESNVEEWIEKTNKVKDEFNIYNNENGNSYIAKYSVRSDQSKHTFSSRPKESYPTIGGQALPLKSKKRSAYKNAFNDKLWRKQWYAQDYRTTDGPVMDLNLVPVYRMGITGKGVTVAVVDEGVQPDHPDLIANYDEKLSYDTINNVPGAKPGGKYLMIPWWMASHGTKCAGIIAMTANNSMCGVGVAFNANIVGVRALGRLETDYSKSRALVHELKFVDIYSNSWGPPDDGSHMEAMSRLVDVALTKGTKEGRGGKGAIYVFAGGNGRKDKDNCAADDLINHPEIIGIAAASQQGRAAPYSEACTAIFATAYSGGNVFYEDGFVLSDEKVVATDVRGHCTTEFSGTSAATPMASGIIALTLEANANLTYRDVMHLIAMSAEVAPLAGNDGTWYRNGAGFWVSNDFGFGLFNAENMVLLAQQWTNVPPKHICTVKITYDSQPKLLQHKQPLIIPESIKACSESENSEINFLELLVLESSISHDYRGGLQIKLTSPAKTVSTVLAVRLQDTVERGLFGWAIKSVHNWGEDPKGEWVFEVMAKYSKGGIAGIFRQFQLQFMQGEQYPKCGELNIGCLYGFNLYLHGTAERPPHHRLLPRPYAAFTLPDGQTNLTPRQTQNSHS